MDTNSESLRRAGPWLDNRDDVERSALLLDPATSWFRQWYTTLRLEEEIRRATRYRRPLSILTVRSTAKVRLISKTNLKWLTALSKLLDALRASDIPGKSARNEYLVILPETDAAGAVVVAERLAHELRDLQQVVGIAVLGTHGVTSTDLLAHARASAHSDWPRAA
jgi:PleD family two-component response regulator